MALNRNPSSYVAEVEQAALAPTNIVPGTGFSAGAPSGSNSIPWQSA